MTLFIYFSALLIGYGVLTLIALIGLVMLYGAIDEIVRYVINKPRKKKY
jgi:hypothetical protein